MTVARTYTSEEKYAAIAKTLERGAAAASQALSIPTGTLSCWVYKARRGDPGYALLLLAIQTGMRVSELIGLRGQDLTLGTGAHIRCRGKGRKERCTPLRHDVVTTLDAWSRERQCQPDQPLFPSLRGNALSPDAVQRLVTKYATHAGQPCPSLNGKHVTPHVLRHTAAMELLQQGVDCSVIALWLGHESIETTQIYLHADLRMKEQALAHTAPLGTTPGRFQPNDALLAFLEAL